MQSYNLSQLATKKSRRSSITLPPIRDSVGPQKDYLKALRAMLRQLAATVRAEIIPEAEREIARQRAALTTDIPGEFVFQRLRALAVQLGVIAEGIVGRILMLESGRHTEKWKSAVRSTIGIDVDAVVGQEDLTEYLDMAVARNASLIKSLSDQVVKDVEQATYRAITLGRTSKQLRSELTGRFKVADSRAKLIARDQMAKLTSDLNRIRHTQAGVLRYEWSTSRDERVRPRHRKLDGTEYRYGEPTGAEEGLPPGQPIQCRCVARGIVVIDGKRF